MGSLVSAKKRKRSRFNGDGVSCSTHAWELTFENGHVKECKWKRPSTTGVPTSMPDVMIRWFHSEYGGTVDRLCGCTEVQIEGKFSIRASPNHGGSRWHDWALVGFGEHGPTHVRRHSKLQGATPTNLCPSRVLAMFQNPHWRAGGDEGGKMLLLVHPCEKSGHKEDSCLIEPWALAYKEGAARHPRMDSTGNIIDGTMPFRALFPSLEVVRKSSVGRLAMCVPEDPHIRTYLRPNKIAGRQGKPGPHSKRVLLIRDRRATWQLNFGATMK